MWNEISRRYVDDEPEFYTSQVLEIEVEDKKQGSSEETVEYNIDGAIQFVTQTYKNLLNANIAPEMQEWFFHRIFTQSGIGLVH